MGFDECNGVRYNVTMRRWEMIRTFRDFRLEQCWREGKCAGVRGNLRRRILMKLDSMDASACLDDLRAPPSNRLHRLKGKYDGFWAISVNGPWRLIFRIVDDDIYDVFLEQYH